jgi:hypothetical protein
MTVARGTDDRHGVTVAFELMIDARGQGMRDLDDQFPALLLLPWVK